jgi:hypothetical protein
MDFNRFFRWPAGRTLPAAISPLSQRLKDRITAGITDLGQPSGRSTLRPATSADFVTDEACLGFSIPPLLKAVYLEVGNGGFGPGYGLIGMTGGQPDDRGNVSPELYLQFREPYPEEQSWDWPLALLPICHWGCGILSCIRCDAPDFPMVIFDPNVHDDAKSWKDAFFDEAASLEGWLEDWASGVNLWDRAYGDSGRITQILNSRAASDEGAIS